jgi:hypothetical protein
MALKVLKDRLKKGEFGYYLDKFCDDLSKLQFESLSQAFSYSDSDSLFIINFTLQQKECYYCLYKIFEEIKSSTYTGQSFSSIFCKCFLKFMNDQCFSFELVVVDGSFCLKIKK